MQQNYIYGNELEFLFDNILNFFKKRKIITILIYLISILYFSLPLIQMPFLEYKIPTFTSLMEQRTLEHNLIYSFEKSNVKLDNVPKYFLKGIIGMEDGNFFYHKGIDWEAIQDAYKSNKKRRRIVRGGSTISMQLSKNLFLTTEKSFLRKAKELLITAQMEKEISKRAILENYINIVEWGDGIFGINAAAKKYFNKSPQELSLNEASRLVAVIPSSLRFDPSKNSRYVLRRASIVRNRINDVILFPTIQRNVP